MPGIYVHFIEVFETTTSRYLQMYVAEITAGLPSWDVVPSNEVRALSYQ